MIIIIMYFNSKVESIANANEIERERKIFIVVGADNDLLLDLYTAALHSQCAMCTEELFTIV